jgi:hypothetical protein
MGAISFLDPYPLWVINLMITGAVLLIIELGWQLGRYRRNRHIEEEKAPVNAAVGATLSLLAFLLAFTFSMAASRFDIRKQVVLREANAIGTTYLRAEFLEENMREEVRSALREYAALRAGGAAAITTAEGMQKSTELQDRLWKVATYAGNHSPSVSTALFIQSLNEMIDLDTERVTANRNRVPDSIWLMLSIVTLLSMVAVGYQFGLTGERSWVVIFFLVAAFSTVITLIADLDRSQGGLVQVSQQPLLDLLVKFGSPGP